MSIVKYDNYKIDLVIPMPYFCSIYGEIPLLINLQMTHVEILY